MPHRRPSLTGIAQGVAGAILVVLLVVVAKASQYAAVAQFGARLGFDLASIIGLSPVLLLAIAIRWRWRRHCAARGTPPA